MSNFFGTNKIVPNGYIYTSHKGSEYIVLEGVWFKHDNLKMVDPSKTQKMNEAAIAQIMKHNSTSKNMIGEGFELVGNTYVRLGENRFTENGIVITETSVLNELLADDERVYEVSRETLNKEWNELKFSILPPHAEDISIPPGLVVNGFKFIPRGQRFQDMKTGSYTDPAMTRRLYDAGLRIAREDASKHAYVPLNSTLITGNEKLQFNGKDFCDSDGNSKISGALAEKILSMYQQFVQSNPQDFPTLVGAKTKEQRFGVGERHSQPKDTHFSTELVQPRDKVTESEGDTESVTVPDGYTITSRADITYYKKDGKWISSQTKQPMNSSAAKSIERAAQTRIVEFNKTAPVKIGETWTSNKGKEYTYVGGDRFIGSDGKLVPTNSAKKILSKLQADRKIDTDSPTDTKDETEVKQEPVAVVNEPVQQDEPKKQDSPKEEPKEPNSTEQSGGSELEALAQEIKGHANSRKIQVLLTRGDKVSLLAADILLSGAEKDAVKILKALNSNDE